MQSTKYTETETDAVRRQWLVAYVICRKKPPEKRMVNMIKPMRLLRPAVRKGLY